MAVIAAGMITLSFERDILANYRYYKLQSSTATPPTKPTSIATLPPSGWTDTEPTYTEGSTNTLYMVDLTTYSDGTFYYTPVLKSSSYEAAKSAYNKAVAAQNTASAAQESIDNLEIGGRNLASKADIYARTTPYTETNYVYQGSYGAGAGLYFLATLFTVGENYVLSFKIKKISGTLNGIGGHSRGFTCNGFYVDGVKSSRTYAQGKAISDDESTHVVNVYLTFNGNSTTDNNLYIQPNRNRYISGNTSVFQIWDIKIERGNKATDWTPAPEDTEQAISDSRSWYAECSTAGATAAKVATITPATTEFTLHTGVIVSVKFTNLNSGAVASLTLNVNGTGAKNIKYINNNTVSNLPAVGYILANQTYQFYYDGTYWIMQINYNSNDNYYDRIRFQVAITAKSAIVAKNIIVAGSDGKYFHLKSNTAFDITYPILYAASAIAVNATGTDNYLAFYFAIATTQALTLTVNKAVYIKGTLNNNLFTPVSTTPLTQTVPTSVDGYQYIRLGFAYSATNIYMDTDHAIYEYNNGGFKTTSQIADEARERVQAMFNNLNGVDQFNALTQNGALNGIFYSDNGNAYINAAFIKTGSLAADKIAVTDLQAFGATIGGFDVDTTSIHTHNVAVTSNAENSVALSSDAFTRTLGGVERANLKLAIGANFGVGKDGTLYATNGVFTGTISGSTIIFNVESEGVDYSIVASTNSWQHQMYGGDVIGTLFSGSGGFGIKASLIDIKADTAGICLASSTKNTQLGPYSGDIELASILLKENGNINSHAIIQLNPEGKMTLECFTLSDGFARIEMDMTSCEIYNSFIFLNSGRIELGSNKIGLKDGGYLGYVGGADSSKSLDNYWTQGQYSVSGSTGRPAKSSAWGILLSIMGNANSDDYTDDYAHSWGLQLYSDNYQLYYRTKTKTGTGAWKNVSTVTKDFTVTLSSLTWAASGSGMYYSSNIMSSAEQSYWDSIDSVSLAGNWSNLRKTDIIIPYAGTNNVALMSNVNSFASSSAKVTVRVTGRRGNAKS